MNAKTYSQKRPHQCQACIDAVLSSLAFRYRDVADPLLDLKLDSGRRTNPGTCIQTYFWLLNRLPPAATEEMRQIRTWLEGLIEVVAFKPNKEFLSRRSIDLNGDSLEQYCNTVMRNFRRETAHDPCDMELQFAFRS